MLLNESYKIFQGKITNEKYSYKEKRKYYTDSSHLKWTSLTYFLQLWNLSKWCYNLNIAGTVMQQNGKVKMFKSWTEIKQVIILREKRSFQPLNQKSLYRMWAIEKAKIHKMKWMFKKINFTVDPSVIILQHRTIIIR